MKGLWWTSWVASGSLSHGSQNLRRIARGKESVFVTRPSTRRTHAQSYRSSSCGLGAASPLATCRIVSDSASLGGRREPGGGPYARCNP
jgi:hypothetical protein